MSLLQRYTCVLLTLSFAAFAQESRGTIEGRVTDPQDAGIVAVKVTVTNVDTGVAVTLTTNDKGVYSAPLLIPGKYRVSAEHPGFKKTGVSNVTLSVNDQVTVDLKMEIGSVNETITVTESAPVLESSNASVGMLLSNKEMQDLPVAHGNPYLLIGLAPGLTFEGDMLLNRPYEPTHIVAYSMGGSAASTTDITMDGVANTSKGSGQGTVAAGYVPPVAAVGEVQVQTSSFDARTAQSSGGAVNISLKSGTNRLHGEASWERMPASWFAGNFFSNKNNSPDGDFGYNRWGASLSGPVAIPKLYNGRNKTFFMWAYEGLKDARPRGGTNLTVPTLAERKGDFSELLALGSNYRIFDPSTRRQQGTNYAEDEFPNNMIPANRINPISLKVLDYFGTPLNTGTTLDHRNNYPQPNSPELARYYTHIGRLDQNFGSKDRVFLRGNGYSRNTSRNDYFHSRATGLIEQYYPIGGSFDEVHTFSPTVLLNVRYGYTRFTRQTDPLHGRGFDLTSIGFPKQYNDLIPANWRELPAFNINGYFNSLSTGEARFMDTHSLVVALTKLKGNHSLEFGFEYRAYRQNRYNGSTSRTGAFTFDTTYTRGPLNTATSAPIGQGFAAFLLGIASSNSQVTRNTDFAEESTAWMGYVQDNWRVRRNLTVNIGVRYELEGPLTERYNRSIRDFNGSVVLPIEAAAQAVYAANYASYPTPELPPSAFHVRGGLVYAGVNGQPRELWARDINNVAPRAGIAWTFAKNTVFRAGYGLFFGALGLRRTDVTQNGFERSTQMIPTKDNINFSATLSNPFPDGILNPTGNSQGFMTDVGNSITFFNPAPKASYNQRWQASLQRQLGHNSVLEVAYVGNRSTKLEITRDLNVVGNEHLSRSPVFDPTVVNYLSGTLQFNPFRGLPGVNGTLGSSTTITRETLLKPYPQFAAVNTSTYQGYSWYHALQIRATRRLSRSLNLNGSYTYSKNMLGDTFLNPGDDVP
ncbi:MAG TPA: TonB-dependent receptor, partial [Candidatus Solibacter sp.]|nr:TonB-dependent receptor [Candidatus Solibacter sp.]